jgi:tetratricopeptide (TPR) repeat protein
MDNKPMRRIAIIALLLALVPWASAADATWKRPGWYRVEIFPSLRILAGPFAGPKSCKKTLPKVEDDIVRCARLAKAGAEIDVALAHFADAIKENPRDATAMNYRGLLYARRGEYDNAIAEHNAAMKANPDDFWAFVFRGKVYAKLGKKKEAEADFRRALAYNPGNEETIATINAELRALGVTP